MAVYLVSDVAFLYVEIFLIRIWVVMLSIILTGLLFGSSGRALDKIQESRIAETAREMLGQNDWLVPHYNGELRLQKPPLTYWTTAASYKIFGVSVLSARLPSVLFALLTAWLIFIWAKQEFSLNVASNAVLILITSFIGLRYFRSGEADATLIFFISLACYAGFKLFEASNKYVVWLLMLGLGLGFLSKGPAAIAIPLVTIIIYAFSIKKLSDLRSLASLTGLTIFAITAFAWYAWILLMMPDIAQNFFSHQVDETFISGTHKQPIYWYLAHALDFFAPWSLLLIPAGIWCYKNKPLPKLIHFSLIWLGVVFVLLTLTVNKQTQYALLLLPPIAIILGYYLEVATGKFYQFNHIVFWLLCVAPLVLIALAVHKQGLEVILAMPDSAYWLLMLSAPFLLKKILKVPSPLPPVLIAAVLTTFMYLFSEQYLTKDDKKSDIKTLMQIADTKAVLYQTMPGNGAVSFYAERAIRPLSEKQIYSLMVTQSELWLVSKDKPVLTGVQLSSEAQVGDWTLWKLTKSQ